MLLVAWLVLVAGGEAGGGRGGGFEVQGGIGEGEGLAGEVVEVRFFERFRARYRIPGLIGPVMAGRGHEQEAMLGIGRVGLQPAFGDVAGMLVRGVAGAFIRGEAGGDDGVAVQDADMDFGLGKVSIGTGGGVEDSGEMLRFTQRAIGAKEGSGGGESGVEIRWINRRRDAVPLFLFGQEDGADEMLVEFDGEDGIELTRRAEGDEIETDGVREGDVAAVKILGGSADGSECSRAHAVIRSLELAGEQLRCGDRVIHRGELQGAEGRTSRREGLRYSDGLGWRGCGRGGAEVMTLPRGCADDAEQGKRKSGEWSERTHE